MAGDQAGLCEVFAYPTPDDFGRSETFELDDAGGHPLGVAVARLEHPEVPLTAAQRDAVLAGLGCIRRRRWTENVLGSHTKVRRVDWDRERWALYTAYAELVRAAEAATDDAEVLTVEGLPGGGRIYHRVVWVYHPADRRLLEAGMDLVGTSVWERRGITYSIKAAPGRPVLYLPHLVRYLRPGEALL
ncbi:hypothetical protein [Kitasatospora sp. NPDC059160]|uniref:hypothetical protein n=1 Tax=Kitasatospora sp. NPDC059160 TaxID=3346748 RepID=UPI0036B823E5